MKIELETTDEGRARLVCWFSCGSTSAVATYFALEKYKDSMPVKIVYCDTGGEHEDNYRFLKDCEDWYEHPITILKSEKYTDIWDVFEKTRYLAGVNGARCTTEMKKRVRRGFEKPDDIQVFGFDASESKRIDKFKANNPEVRLEHPLFDKEYSKQDCLNFLSKHKIEPPAIYKMGYLNANCIGCVKGGMGYWNKIRKDFPEVFERMSKLERQFNVALCKSYAVDGKRKRVFLDELDPEAGRYESELEIMKCGLVCGE